MSTVRRTLVATTALFLAAGALWWLTPSFQPAVPDRAAPSWTTPERIVTAEPAPAIPASPSPQLSDAPPPGTPPLVGRVLDHRGRGVAGARITARPELVDDAVQVSGRTASDGRFRIALPRPAAAWSLVVEATACSPWRVKTVFPDEERIIRVDPERRATGTVTGADGEPVAGARVAWLGFLGEIPIERVTHTGPDGAFRLEGLPSPAAQANAGEAVADPSTYLEARAPGYAPALVELDPEEGEAEELRRDLVVTEGATIEGRVVDAGTGAPIPRARVVAWTYEPAGAALHGHPVFPRVLGDRSAGNDGTFLLPHLPETSLQRTRPIDDRLDQVLGLVGAAAPGFVPVAREVAALVDRSRQTLELRLSPAASVTGRVVDEAGKPLRGVSIGWTAPDYESEPFPAIFPEIPLRPVPTDAEGRYTREAVRARRGVEDRVKILAFLPDRWQEAGSVEVAVRAGERATAPDVVLSRAGQVQARLIVRDPDGAPVPDALVGPDDRPGFHQVRTNAQGIALAPMVNDPNRRDRFLVQAPGRAPAFTPRLQPSADLPAQAFVTLSRSRRIAGFARRADGRPVPGILVSAASAKLSFDGFLSEPLHPGSLWIAREEGIVRSSVTGADGSFEIVGLADGPCHVGTHAGHQRVVLTGVSAGTLDVTLLIPPAPQDSGGTITVEGTVVDAETREPLRRFEVRISLSDRVLTARPSQPGRFRFENVPFDPSVPQLDLTASADGYVDERIQPAGPIPPAPLAPLYFTLRRGVAVRGSVKGPEGLDLTGAVVRFEELRFQGPVARIGPDGRYAFQGIDPMDRPEDRRPSEVPGLSEPSVLHPIVERSRFGQPDLMLAVRPPAELRRPLRGREVRLDLEVVRGGRLLLDRRPSQEWTAREPWKLEIRDAARQLVRLHTLSGDRWYMLVLPCAYPPGDYTVRLVGTTGPMGTWNASVAEGQTTTVHLDPP